MGVFAYMSLMWGDHSRGWHRLGVLREAVSQLVKRAQRQGVTVIAIEKLNFADIRTRQRGRRGKAGRTTRRKVAVLWTVRSCYG